MSAANCIPNPIYGQAYRLYGKITDSTTGNPITGGLTSLAAQVSKDGASFTNTTNAPVEIGTSGYFSLDLTAAEMSYSADIVRVTAANSNAIEFSLLIPIANLTPTAGRADTAAIVRMEQILLEMYGYFFNQQTISAALQTVFLSTGATMVTGAVSNDGNGGSTRGILS